MSFYIYFRGLISCRSCRCSQLFVAVDHTVVGQEPANVLAFGDLVVLLELAFGDEFPAAIVDVFLDSGAVAVEGEVLLPGREDGMASLLEGQEHLIEHRGGQVTFSKDASATDNIVPVAVLFRELFRVTKEELLEVGVAVLFTGLFEH